MTSLVLILSVITHKIFISQSLILETSSKQLQSNYISANSSQIHTTISIQLLFSYQGADVTSELVI